MRADEPLTQTLKRENDELRRQLAEANDTLEAIRSGEVDALVVRQGPTNQVFTLEGADHPYRVFVEEMHQGALSLSASFLVLYCNPRFSQMLQCPPEQITGRGLESHVAPASRAAWQGLLEEARTGRAAAELQLLRQDGTSLPALAAVTPLPPPSDKKFIMVITDLTERKLHERLVATELNQDLDLPVVMRRLVETGANLTGATSGVYGLMEGSCLRVREHLREGCWEPVDLSFEPGQGVPGWIMNTHLSRLSADAAGDPQVQKASILCLGIRTYAALPILGRMGEMLGYFGIHNKAQGTFTEEDRTLLTGLATHASVAMENTRLVEVLRQEREALHLSEYRYRSLVDRLHEGLAQTDTQGHITFANPRLGEMLAYPEGEPAEGLDLSILASQPVQGEGPAPAERTLPGLRGTYEAQLQRRDGVALDVLVSKSPIQDDAGTLLGSLVLITDNTEHKQAELLFRQAQKGESLALMAGGIAHDFNNLFQALQSNLELGQAQLRDPQRLATSLERSLQLLGKAASLSGKMLEYSGRSFIRSEGVELAHLLGHNEGLLRELAGDGCALTVALEGPGAEIAGDPNQLLQVMAALVCNAAEAAGGGPVQVRILAGLQTLRAEELATGYWPEPVKEGEYVVLSVLDDGPGVDPELLGKIFDPFFTTKAPGRGLGLSSALGIIRAHKAGLQVHSEPGQGTRIRIFFPQRGALAPWEPRIAPAPAQVNGQKTILLVDDDDDLRSTIQEVLESLLGHAVLVAKDGLESVEVFRKSPEAVDLILMDATMPRMNGREAFARIKELRPNTKAILCSGFSESLGQEQARESGFLGFLKKPFPIQKLKEVVEKALA